MGGEKKPYKYESYMCPTTPESFLYDEPVIDPRGSGRRVRMKIEKLKNYVVNRQTGVVVCTTRCYVIFTP